MFNRQTIQKKRKENVFFFLKNNKHMKGEKKKIEENHNNKNEKTNVCMYVFKFYTHQLYEKSINGNR